MNAITCYLSSNLSRFGERRGSDFFKACCPFHDEKNPSFSVHKVSGSFVCFACGEKGDVIAFVSKLFGITPYEAKIW